MECKHNAYLEIDGGKKCLLCGAFIPANEDVPVNGTETGQEAAEGEKVSKPSARKRTAKNAK